MKSSNLFSDYMVASSVNRSIRSINNSPTSGVIHKQRSSYGPRLTLVNKSRDESMSKSRQHIQQQSQHEQYIQKIFLLMLQTSRLQQLHQQSIKQSSQSIKQSKLQTDKQLLQYRQSNQTLKIAIKTLQGSLMKCEQQKMRLKMENQQRTSQLQLQVKTWQLRMVQTQKQLQRIKRDKQQLLLQIQRQSIQRAKSSSITQSRTFLFQQQKTRQHQLTYQISSLRQQLSKYKLTINQQQSIIRKLKQENQSLQQRQIHLLMANHQYANQFQEIKKKINYQLNNVGVNTQVGMNDMVKKDSIQLQYTQLRQQLTTLQYELSQKHKQYMNRQKDNDLLTNQIKQKQLQIKQKQIQMKQLKQQLKQKIITISQLKMTNDMMREKMQKLNSHVTQRQFWSSRKLQSLEQQLKQKIKTKQQQMKQLQQQITQLQQQNIVLKDYIQQQSTIINMKQLQYTVQNNDLQNKLKRTQRKLKSVQKTSIMQGYNNSGSNNKNGDNIYVNNSTAVPQTRLFKSRSIQSTSFFSYNNINNNINGNNNRKGLLDVNLQNIVTATASLQGSTQRSLRLINRSQQKLITSCMSPIKSKRKVFVQINNSSSKDVNNNKTQQRQQQSQNSEISFEQGRTRYNKNKVSSTTRLRNNNNDDNMRSSIHQYYGLGEGNMSNNNY